MSSRRALLISCAAASALGALALRAPAAPDPYAIFGKARAYWLTQRYPMALRYAIAVDIIEGGKERVEHYDASYDAEKNVIAVDPRSDYERAHPVVPKGANFSVFGVRVNKPMPAVDFIGVPKLSPTYTFGMAPFVPAPTPTPFNPIALVEEIRKKFHDPNPRGTVAPPTPTPLPEIAVVVARTSDYAVTLDDIETIDGHACYHLVLKPTHDSYRYRLRDAWIDEATYATWRVTIAQNFTSGPGMKVPWTVHFADIDGAHYIAEEDADAPMSASGEIYTKTSLRFEHLVSGLASTPRLSIGNVEPPDLISEP